MFLDVIEGIAHEDDQCPGYREAISSAEGEPQIGFHACAVCGKGPIEWPDDRLIAVTKELLAK